MIRLRLRSAVFWTSGTLSPGSAKNWSKASAASTGTWFISAAAEIDTRSIGLRKASYALR